MANEATALPERTQPAGTAGREAAVEFRVSDRQRAYVVWLLFAVYVLNFVDRHDPDDADPADQGGVQVQRHAARFARRAGVRVPVLDARHSDRALRRSHEPGRGHLGLAPCMERVHGVDRARAHLHALPARARCGRGGRGRLQPLSVLDHQRLLHARAALDRAVDLLDGHLWRRVLRLSRRRPRAQAFGWRATFWVVGLPGVVLALVVKRTLREPPRGFSDPHAPRANPRR